MLESPTLRPASEESLHHREPLQDIVVAVPSQYGAGGDQVPGERTVVPGLEERVTEFQVSHSRRCVFGGWPGRAAGWCA